MNWKDLNFYPIMGVELSAENTAKLDFSISNKELKLVDVSDTSSFDSYVFEKLDQLNKSFGVGGYLEHRAIYQRAEMFATAAEDFRNIHLGVDIWTAAGAEVYVPFDGKVVSVQDNVGFANYGPTIILEHEIEGKKLFSLYGHLSRTDLKFLRKGQYVIAGELLCHVGPFPENGDWPPHLHFQLMWGMEGNVGDYPGVCSERELNRYSLNCPDPNLMIRSEVLD